MVEGAGLVNCSGSEESLAQHRGSVLGRLPEQAQPSQKWFDSALLQALQKLDPARPIYVEAESNKIGTITLPPALVTAMHAGGTGMTRLEFRIPTRGLIGYRSEFLTDTRGLGIMASRFSGYGAWCGEINGRNRGSMISLDMGIATGYSLENLQQRGTLFISPMTEVYAGMIIGENSRPGPLICNPTKRKALTNHRASNKDQTVSFDVPRILTLDAALEWIAQDELVEVTPASIRVRKMLLDFEIRKKSERRTALAG